EEALGHLAGRDVVTLDLTDLDFIDASGIGAIVRGALGCRIVLWSPRPQIQRVFQLCGIDHHPRLEIRSVSPSPGDGPGAWSRSAALRIHAMVVPVPG
ncbi:MAG TPA: STAS domain-containing protein, partial [Actinomycetota bacterium]|nr:STAS domain-containing protein [Actinomycetota bacterium]